LFVCVTYSSVAPKYLHLQSTVQQVCSKKTAGFPSLSRGRDSIYFRVADHPGVAWFGQRICVSRLKSAIDLP